jgi:hypothetical protein
VRCTTGDTGELISDAEVAETVYTAFAGTRHEYTARLVVRRVKDKNSDDALFPVWRPHAFLTNTALSTVEADLTGSTRSSKPPSPTSSTVPWRTCPPATSTQAPPGSSAPPSPPNLLRAAGSLTSTFHAKARGATLRKHLVCVPTRLARPQGRPVLHLPRHRPWAEAVTTLHAATGPPTAP